MSKQKYQLDQFVKIKGGELKNCVGRVVDTYYSDTAQRTMYCVDGHKETGTSCVRFSKYFFSHEIELAENPPVIISLPLKEPVVMPYIINGKPVARIILDKPSDFDKLIAILKEEKENLIRQRQKAFDDKHQLSLF